MLIPDSEYSNIKPSILVKASFKVIKKLDMYPSKYKAMVSNVRPFHQTKIGQLYTQIKIVAKFYEKNNENKDLEYEFYRLMDSLVANLAKSRNINLLAISEMIKLEGINLSENMIPSWFSAYSSVYTVMIIASVFFGINIMLSFNKNTEETEQATINQQELNLNQVKGSWDGMLD